MKWLTTLSFAKTYKSVHLAFRRRATLRVVGAFFGAIILVAVSYSSEIGTDINADKNVGPIGGY